MSRRRISGWSKSPDPPAPARNSAAPAARSAACIATAGITQPFVCLLGDTIFSGDPAPAAQLVVAYQKFGASIIGLEEVPTEKVDRYGIVGGEEIEPGVFGLNSLVEKPAKDSAPSRLAIAARYVLTPGIFACLEQTPSGRGGEIQLTDALRLLLEREPIYGIVLQARRHDIGNPLDWLKTNLIFAARDPQLRSAIEPLMRELFDRA